MLGNYVKEIGVAMNGISFTFFLKQYCKNSCIIMEIVSNGLLNIVYHA
jgi:hypothetical protein